MLPPGVPGRDRAHPRALGGRPLPRALARALLPLGRRATTTRRCTCRSADWMSRNMFRRIEIAWPVRDRGAAPARHRRMPGALPARPADAWELQRRRPLRARRQRRAERAAGADAALRRLTTEPTMDLILWRHAEAVDRARGPGRPRPRAHAQGRAPGPAHGRVAEPAAAAHSTRILVSPALRCQQTAKALEPQVQDRRRARARARASTRCCRPRAGPTRASRCWWSATSRRSAWSRRSCCPGSRSPGRCKKGAVWWLRSREREGAAQVVLQAVMGPDCL